MGIHFLGLKNIDKPTVWVFPKLLVCLGCGFTEFIIRDAERGLQGWISRWYHLTPCGSSIEQSHVPLITLCSLRTVHRASTRDP
jgi:hypothetical protein